MVDINAKPSRVSMRCSLYVATQLLCADPCVAIRFGGIGPNLTAVEASETVDNLMLDQAVVEFGTIADNEKGHERAGNSHFLHQAPPRRSIHLLSRPRVAAAGVGPQPPGMIFVAMPLLQEQAPALVPELNGDRAVQATLSVRRELWRHADGAIIGIDEDHLLRLDPVHHDVPRCTALEPRRRASQTESAV